MFLHFVLGIAEAEALDPVLFSSQSHKLVLGIIPKTVLNGITGRLWNVNEQKTFLKGNHQRASKFTVNRSIVRAVQIAVLDSGKNIAGLALRLPSRACSNAYY